MRLRFLAAAGPADAFDRLVRKRAAAGGCGLEPVLRAPGLAVWAPPGTPHVAAPDCAAVAIGLVFDRADGRRLAHLPRPVPPDEEFVARYWGAYALLAARGEREHRILRDPSGAVTAYRRRCGALDLHASDAALLAAASAERLEPDTDFVRHWLTYPGLRASLTGVRGVRELVPGSAWRRVGGTAGLAPAWSPWELTRPDEAIGDFETAAALVRETVLATVPRLADGRTIVVPLSGGLDSSIVAAALAQAGRDFRAVTFATRARDGDERIHARAVARHCGVELAELVEQAAVPDLAAVPAPAFRPQANALLQPLHRAVANHLALSGADLVLDGTGGDNAFCYLSSASPALDAFRRRSPRAGLAAVHDLARLHRTTLWAAARAVRRRARRPRGTWPRDETFLAPGAAALHPLAHPWLEGAVLADRGTCEHVQSIVGVYHFLQDPAPGAVAAIHPLLAQPIVETCLRIPSWLWLRGGRDRAVARAAFRGLLPDSTLARRSKGHLGSLFMTGYMAARGQLEEWLLEGRLAQTGLLDRAAIRDYLRRDGQPRDAGYIRLLDMASAEGWLRALAA